MKELNLEKMEEINGGGIWSCLGAGLSGTSVLVGGAALAAGLASGPIGWIALGVSAASLVLTAADGDPCDF